MARIPLALDRLMRRSENAAAVGRGKFPRSQPRGQGLTSLLQRSFCPNAFNRYVKVAADHLGTPDASREGSAEAWLKDLQKSP